MNYAKNSFVITKEASKTIGPIEKYPAIGGYKHRYILYIAKQGNFCYDNELSHWYEISNLNYARVFRSVVTLADTAYVFGGRSDIKGF